MTSEERRLLRALAWMCQQYISDKGQLDHMCMSAGEGAVALLVEYGFVDPHPRGGTWTKTGHELLDSDD